MTRTVFLDHDTRPRPKTDLWCIRCQKDLKPGSGFRFAYVTDDMEAVHPSDIAGRVKLKSDHGFCPIGTDCSRKIGIEFTLSEIPA